MDDPHAVEPFTVPATITIGGMFANLVVLEMDYPGPVELTPDQARAIATDLITMADEAEA